MKKCGILQAMGEARKVIITFLILLFVIIGLGVLFSKMSKSKTDKPILGGVLDNIFFSKSLRTSPTPTPGSNMITIRKDSITPTPMYVPGGSSNNPNQQQPNSNGSIPATGTSTNVLLFSAAGLASGLFLKRYNKG